MQLEPPVLDPTVNPAAAISEALYGNLYEGLGAVRPRRVGAPSLAESWEISRMGSPTCSICAPACAFTTASAFDAATAKYSLERALARDSVNPQRSRIAAIRSVQALDDRTLRCRSRRRSGGLLQSLAWASFVMVEPRSAASESDAAGRHGSFSISRLEPRAIRSTLERYRRLLGRARALSAR